MPRLCDHLPRPRHPPLPAARTHAGAAEIGISLRMTAAEVRSRLVALENRRFIASRSDKAEGKPRRVYFFTAEGIRAARTSEAYAH